MNSDMFDSQLRSLLREHSLHTRPTMIHEIPDGVRRAFVHWYGEELLDTYHFEYDTLLWVPWSDRDAGSILMLRVDRYELYHYAKVSECWVETNPADLSPLLEALLSTEGGQSS